MSANRVAAGCAIATIIVVIALSPGGWAVAEPVLLVLAGLVLLGTFAPNLPLLHKLPLVGAPRAELRITADAIDDGEMILRVAIFNSGPGELLRGRVNVLVPEPTQIRAVDALGKTEQRGHPLPPTSEQVLAGKASNVWFDREDFDPEWTMLHYGLRFPVIEGGVRFPVRVKFVSKSTFGGELCVEQWVEGG